MKKSLVLGSLASSVLLATFAADAEAVPPRVFRVAGHTHTCRGTQFPDAHIETRLAEWAARNEVSACGLGSPWCAAQAAQAVHYEREFRDAYYAGKTDPASPIDLGLPSEVVRRANASEGNRTLYYVDNETPKSRYGHCWYVGFKVVVPGWHDYDQGLEVWYSPLDDRTAATNSVTGLPQKRRTYREVVDEQRRAGALCIWAHPTSWWTTNGDPNGPFTTNIAAEMLPQLMEDGYLDGLTVQGYDAFHRDYQALWFALLDRGYRVPGFSELDMSVGHNTTSWDTGFFNLLPDDGKTELTEAYLIGEFRKARHTMSSGPLLFMTVDGAPQGSELESGEGRRHEIRVTAWPAKGERKLSRVELLGRGGEILDRVKDFAGGELTFSLSGTDAGGYVVIRAFGENDADYVYKAQQRIRHCAVTNPVWLRTDRFRAPAPIKTKIDHMANPKVRELMDYLARGHFRKDYPGCAPGIVPTAAWRMDEMAEALAR